MAENTNIEWCDSTFNPWIGCTKVSVGPQGACVNCYAEVATPVRAMRIMWGPGKPRYRTSASTWALPLRWERNAAAFQAEHGRRQRVFCASLADVFDNEVDTQWRVDLFRLIQQTPHLDWLLLTKRIGNARQMLNDTMSALHHSSWDEWPWAHVWLGATVVTQEEAERDIPKLLQIDARVRFLSCEPLLGPINFAEVPGFNKAGSAGRDLLNKFWVVAGGESGPRARPSHPDWFRSLRDQCVIAGVPFHFKQHGAWAELDGDKATRTVESDQQSYDAEAARCDGFISHDGHFVRSMDDARLDVPYRGLIRIGKKAAGRLLDGREHNDSPGVSRS